MIVTVLLSWVSLLMMTIEWTSNVMTTLSGMMLYWRSNINGLKSNFFQRKKPKEERKTCTCIDIFQHGSKPRTAAQRWVTPRASVTSKGGETLDQSAAAALLLASCFSTMGKVSNGSNCCGWTSQRRTAGARKRRRSSRRLAPGGLGEYVSGKSVYSV